jgi:GTP-binding protein Era
MNIKTGYVAIIGLPNSGKSSLLNSFFGQKFSIVSAKPQTTRKRILGILTEENYQVIFLDTPGILAPKYLLQKKMMEAVQQSIEDADLFVLLLDLKYDPEGKLLLENEIWDSLIKNSEKPKILVLNKMDIVSEEQIEKAGQKFERIEDFKKVISASATSGTNVKEILDTIIKFLPEGPKYYPDDIISEDNERFFVSEIIREKILEQYEEEIPYSVEVVIADFKERNNGKDYIYAEIFVERESQRKVMIGKNAAAIKKLGQSARKDIEEFLQREVFLELRAKVKDKWRKNEKYLKGFGYSKYSSK